MIFNDCFCLWVANTITQCGGNGSEYLRDIERKRALTYLGSRAAACQVSKDFYFHTDYSAFMRPSGLATTNKTTFH